jgi:heat shock protein HtpX
VEGIFGLILAIFMKGVALIPYGLYLIMIHLLWQDKQRVEYYADLVSADLTGTKASVSLMEKILYSQVFFHTVQKAAVTKGGSHFYLV